MVLFNYEKPNIREVTADELRSFGIAMLSSGGGSGGGGSVSPRDKLAEGLFKKVGFRCRRNAGYVYWLRMLSNRLSTVYGSSTAAKRAWLFFRIIGGFCYSGGMQYNDTEMKWDFTAGWLSYTSEDTPAPPDSELDFFVNKLGFDEKSYRLFRYYTRVQHAICGNPDNPLSAESLNAALGNCFTGSDKWLETGDVIGVDTLDRFHDEVKVDMRWKSDFAHMCITAASMLATGCVVVGGPAHIYLSSRYPRLCSLLGVNEVRERMAGWLGDAVLVNEEKGKTMFGDDDYKADLDAVDVAFRIRKGETALVALESCLSSGRSRRLCFLEKISLDEVIACINRGIEPQAEVSDQVILKRISESAMYADTYRFYRVLAGQIVEP